MRIINYWKWRRKFISPKILSVEFLSTEIGNNCRKLSRRSSSAERCGIYCKKCWHSIIRKSYNSIVYPWVHPPMAIMLNHLRFELLIVRDMVNAGNIGLQNFKTFFFSIYNFTLNFRNFACMRLGDKNVMVLFIPHKLSFHFCYLLQ